MGHARRRTPDHEQRRTGPRGALNLTPGLRISLTVSLLLGGSALVGCAQSDQRSESVSFDTPRVSNGSLMIDADEREDGLDRIAAALEDIQEPAVSPGMLASLRDRVQREELQAASDPASPHLGWDETGGDRDDVLNAVLGELRGAKSNPSEDDPQSPPIELPKNAGRLIPLEHRMSLPEIQDLISSLSLQYQTEGGYRSADASQRDMLGADPQGVSAGPTLVRTAPDGARSVLQFGFASYLSQLPQLWSRGVVIAPDGAVAVNPDLDGIQTRVDASLAQVQKMRSGLTQNDVDRKIIQLSYVNPDGALNALKGLGINTIPSVEGLPATIDYNQLPMVTKMPTAKEDQIGLVGEAASSRGAFGQTTTPNNASNLNAEVYAGPTSQLMVIYHPAHPEQFSLVRSILDEYIDRPARLVFVEGLVLEISEDGLDELGVQWSYQHGAADLIIGSLDPSGIMDTLNFTSLDSRDLAKDWGIKIRALISDGKAEILSRPSVLTMNNRQATIRVGEDIPIATSQEGVLNNSNKVAFNFQYLPTGILLNIRPRLSEKGDEVSMLIDTVVSARVPGRDLEIRSADGDLLASAPTISTRRVQTYARIENTTPFIIGGLVSRDHSVIRDKVPLLGDLPLIGPAFRSERTSTEKREVIIVLTPYVLPDDQSITRAIPKDDDLFDSKGNQLFRDAFRIRAEDVFDLRFLAENKRLMIYRGLAEELINNNFKLADEEPFSEFANSTIPGEEILIQRMIYEVIKRTDVDARVNPERIIYFEAKDYEGYNVRFLNYALSQLGDGVSAESFFDRNTGKALAITYTYSRESMKQRDLASEPIPEISLVDCPNRDAWQQLLWDMNQPSADGIGRYTILIHSRADIARLQRAIMLKKIILLNGGEGALNLSNFSIGKILHIPKLGEENVSVVDADVARYFFHTELYYAAIIKRIEDTLKKFDGALQDPAVQMHLRSRRAVPSAVKTQ